MSSTPSKVPSISSSTSNANNKHSSSSTPGQTVKASKHNSHGKEKENKKHKSSKSGKEGKLPEDMDGDELVDHLIGDNDSSISSLDVSEDEAPKGEEKSKKRKREDETNVQYEDEPLTETLLYASFFFNFHLPIGSLKGTILLNRFTLINSILFYHFQLLKYLYKPPKRHYPQAQLILLPLAFNSIVFEPARPIKILTIVYNLCLDYKCVITQ